MTDPTSSPPSPGRGRPSPKTVGVVLAAGPSRRFRSEHGETLKQLLAFQGESLIRRAVRAGLASGLERLLVVVGCDASRVAGEITDLAVEIVDNPRFNEGQSSSVRAAVARLPTGTDAALFVPCDQPLLDAATIDRILERRRSTGASIVVPVADGRRGAPVLFGRELFAELARIEGDAGGRQLFDTHRESIAEVELPSALPLCDIDTPADYAALLERASGGAASDPATSGPDR